jgi:hypothetical protein
LHWCPWVTIQNDVFVVDSCFVYFLGLHFLLLFRANLVIWSSWAEKQPCLITFLRLFLHYPLLIIQCELIIVELVIVNAYRLIRSYHSIGHWGCVSVWSYAFMVVLKGHRRIPIFKHHLTPTPLHCLRGLTHYLGKLLVKPLAFRIGLAEVFTLSKFSVLLATVLISHDLKNSEWCIK